MITWSQLGLQDSLSPIIEEFIFFHDFIILILVVIIRFVSFIMCSTSWNQFIDKTLLENQILECIWTLLPGVILIQIAIPSLSLLYLFEEALNSRIRVKVVGHQWYWSYEYWDFKKEEEFFRFDSYIISSLERLNQFRLLDVDSRLILPYATRIRALVTSADVLHAWAIPRLGIKADAAPGRLNQLIFLRQRSGVFFGQCSEICGANHSFIPIVVEIVKARDFIKWIFLSKE